MRCPVLLATLLLAIALYGGCVSAAETVQEERDASNGEKKAPDAKMVALQWHRHVQAGVRKRQEEVNNLSRKIARETRPTDALRADLSSVEKVLLKMRYWMKTESSKQTESRFNLLREREINCLNGYDEKCNYFQEGFLDDGELYVKNAPPGFMQKTRKRDVSQRSKRGVETEYLKSLSSQERVRSSLCEAIDMIPDPSLRAFTTVGEYLSYQDSPGGVKSRKMTPTQKKKQTFFNKFEKTGPEGGVHMMLAFGETFAIIVSPLTTPFYVLYFAYFKASAFMWSHIQSCKVEDSTYPSFTRPICAKLDEVSVPGTFMYEILNFFDYTTYSYLNTIMDNYVFPYTAVPSKFMKLLWYAPLMYWDYYVLGKDSLLPPTRNMCLLQSGTEAAKKEVQDIKYRIQEEQELRESILQRDKDLDSGNVHGLQWVDYGLQREYEVLKRVCTDKIQGEHQYNVCFFKNITRTLHTTSASADDSVAKQEAVTVLGHYKRWGKSVQEKSLEQEVAESEAASLEASSKSNSKSSKSGLLDAISKRVAGTSGAERRTLILETMRSQPNYFTHQFYNEGDACDGHKQKYSSEISLECGPTLEVVEIKTVGNGNGNGNDCNIVVHIRAPIACTPAVEQASLDELDRLGVFGFTKKTSKTAVKKSIEESIALKKAKQKTDADTLQGKRAKMGKEKRAKVEEGEVELKEDKKTAFKEAQQRARDKDFFGPTGIDNEKKRKQEEKEKEKAGGSEDKNKKKESKIKMELEVDVDTQANIEVDSGIFSLPDDQVLIGGVLRPKDQLLRN